MKNQEQLSIGENSLFLAAAGGARALWTESPRCSGFLSLLPIEALPEQILDVVFKDALNILLELRATVVFLARWSLWTVAALLLLLLTWLRSSRPRGLPAGRRVGCLPLNQSPAAPSS